MDLSSYYQSVFYQSRETVHTPCTQQSVYSVCGEVYTQPLSPECERSVYNCHTVTPESYSYESDSLSPSPQYDSHMNNCHVTLTPTSPCYRQSSPRPSKLPHIPPLAVLQQRRLAANARERKRANKINFAFNRLKKVLPGFQDREISKFEAIQLAQDYIKQLVEVLGKDGEVLEKDGQGRQNEEGLFTKV